MKPCAACFQPKPLTEFYAQPKARDGLMSKCKDCHRAAMIANRNKNIERYREFDRKRAWDPRRVMARKLYQQTPAFRESHSRACAAYADNHPNKKTAHTAVSNAVRDGRLKKQPCEVCGVDKAQAHHDDYDKPLDVRWLCVPHHAEHHKKLREAERNRAA